MKGKTFETDGGGILLLLVMFALDGFVMRDLWRWFVGPAFRLPDISYWTALGLSVTAGWLVFMPSQARNEDSPETNAGMGILASLITWGLGAIVACIR